MLETPHFDAVEQNKIPQQPKPKTNNKLETSKPRGQFEMSQEELNDVYSWLEQATADVQLQLGLKTRIDIKDKNRGPLTIYSTPASPHTDNQEHRSNERGNVLNYDVISHNQEQSIKIFYGTSNYIRGIKQINLEPNNEEGEDIICNTMETAIAFANLKNYLIEHRKKYDNPTISYKAGDGMYCKPNGLFAMKQGYLSQEILYTKYPALKNEATLKVIMKDVELSLQAETDKKK